MSHPVIKTIDAINGLDEKKIIRKNLGDAAFLEFESIWEEIKYKINFIEKFYPKTTANTNNQISSHLTHIHQQLTALVGYDKSQFVAQQASIKKNINNQLEAIKKYWPEYAIAAIEDSGLLSNVDVREKFESLTNELKESTESALLKIEEESKQIVENAKKKAQEIESSVRKTAQNISVAEAQAQFQDAAEHNIIQIKIWGGITIGLVITFICFILYLLLGIELPEKWDWSIGYLTIIRLGVLGLISTIIGFSLKMLRANLHMHQHNLHRKRIANSMASFAESAMNSDQRDLILSQLVESVSNFGNSGLINKENESSTISIDSITKTVSSLKEK